MRKLLFAVAGLALFTASCKKEDPIDTSKTKYLMDDYWRLTKSIYISDISDPLNLGSDIYPDMMACVKDNFMKFNTASTYTVYDHYVKCSPGDPDTREFFWQLSNNETHLKIFADPALPDETVYLQGDMTYRSIDTFILTYTTFDEDTEITSRTTNTYVKFDNPD